jgi:hypothetical protein
MLAAEAEDRGGDGLGQQARGEDADRELPDLAPLRAGGDDPRMVGLGQRRAGLARKRRPASVSCTLRLVRSSSVAFSSCSSARICWLSGGWEMPSLAAARLKCSSSARTTK